MIINPKRLILFLFMISLVFTQEVSEFEIVDERDGSIDRKSVSDIQGVVDGNSTIFEFDNYTLQVTPGDEKENEDKERLKQEAKKFPAEDNPYIFDDIPGYRVRSEQELKYLLEISDLTFLRFAYKTWSVKSRKAAADLITIVEKLKNLAGVLLIDCDIFKTNDQYTTYPACKQNDLVADSFPNIKLLISPENRYDLETNELSLHYEYPYTESDITENKLYNFIANNIPSKAYKLNKDNIYNFLHNDLFNKILLFTNKKQPSLLFRGLTNYFYDRILFGEVLNTEKELIQRFNITKFPTLILYKMNDHNRLLDEPEITEFKGLSTTEHLIKFIDPHAIREKRYISSKRDIYEEDINEVASRIQLREVSETTLDEYLDKFKDKNVIVYFDTKEKLKHSYKKELIRNQ